MPSSGDGFFLFWAGARIHPRTMQQEIWRRERTGAACDCIKKRVRGADAPSAADPLVRPCLNNQKRPTGASAAIQGDRPTWNYRRAEMIRDG